MKNLTESDLSRSIYRIMSLPHLKLMLKDKTLALGKTSSWEDPYENFFFKERFMYDGNKVTLENLIPTIFGQCWSTFKDSDALWRIYSADKKFVRITTTIQKLFDAVYIDNSCMANTYIGKVDYKAKKDIDLWITDNSPVTMHNILRLSVDSLFIKRRNFSHEDEVRVIYQPASKDSIEAGSPLKIYDIDPNDFIDEIAFDPRADDSYVATSTKAISKLKFPLSRVHKSPLYDFRPHQITIK